MLALRQVTVADDQVSHVSEYTIWNSLVDYDCTIFDEENKHKVSKWDRLKNDIKGAEQTSANK